MRFAPALTTFAVLSSSAHAIASEPEIAALVERDAQRPGQGGQGGFSFPNSGSFTARPQNGEIGREGFNGRQTQTAANRQGPRPTSHTTSTTEAPKASPKADQGNDKAFSFGGQRPSQGANGFGGNFNGGNFGNFGGPSAAGAPQGIPTNFPGGGQVGKVPTPQQPAAFAPNFGIPSKGNCPAIWSQISKDLTGLFSDNGQCNDFARAAIRVSFHDCGTWKQSLGTSAGCDGSIYLAKEYTRSENAGMGDNVQRLGQLAEKYGVGVADFIQFAGAHAVVTCPLGPKVQTFVGRKDRSTANPEGLLPNARASGDDIYQNMLDKGLNAGEQAALIGAHTSAKQFAFDPAKSGAALDTTPGVWDVKFYSQVLDKSAPFVLVSDIALANQAQVGPEFKKFVNNQFGWDVAYAPAMTKMSLMGVDTGNLIDCTSALPNPRFANKREVIGHLAPHLLVSS